MTGPRGCRPLYRVIAILRGPRPRGSWRREKGHKTWPATPDRENLLRRIPGAALLICARSSGLQVAPVILPGRSHRLSSGSQPADPQPVPKLPESICWHDNQSDLFQKHEIERVLPKEFQFTCYESTATVRPQTLWCKFRPIASVA